MDLRPNVALSIDLLTLEAPFAMQPHQWRAHAELIAQSFGEEFGAMVQSRGVPPGLAESRAVDLPVFEARAEPAAATGRRLAETLYSLLAEPGGVR